MLNLIRVMYQLHMLSPRGVLRLAAAVWKYGVNLMALVCLAARTYGDRIAISDEREAISYRQLWRQSERLAMQFRQQYGLARGKKIGVMCNNHASLVKTVFAASNTGADIYLLNTGMGLERFNQLAERHGFDLLVHDAELTPLVAQSAYVRARLLSYGDDQHSVNRFAQASDRMTTIRRKRASAGRIMLLTGGTTGRAKEVPHRPSLFYYLPPFITLLSRLKLKERHSIYIATPIYHGYGIAFLLLCTALGKKIMLTAGFDAAKSCAWIAGHKADVVTVVPLMLLKMIRHDSDQLKSLVCIASGGAELAPGLIEEVHNRLGHVLYNLYGTSEAGLCTVATSQDLRELPLTIGKAIDGLKLHLLDDRMKPVGIGTVGRLCLKNKWSLSRSSHSWLETGDMGCRDGAGYYYWCGRADDMIVSGGENVYPIELERLLHTHPLIEDAAVIGIPDEWFGQRLKAMVQLIPNAVLTEEELLTWLRSKAARYQMPKVTVFVDEIAYTSLGKRDKKRAVIGQTPSS
ncbi:AMP-binding protein [Paenibacillus sp. J5C_2022]|uniref:AMP-binding protein n=1 Tax=Paenibacillus sp. J5C2022 TaxID=2977129 RepID=UPI0021D0D6C8|nr:AMP-binding protein [Paenibacillus sp. J5C2022]MCU6709984.1 AMP-binding protein [Paenibacillus sp. J5C2022]